MFVIFNRILDLHISFLFEFILFKLQVQIDVPNKIWVSKLI